jgi:hypothetical protein
MRSCLNDLTTRAFQLGGLLLQSSEVRASWKFFEPTIRMKFQARREGKISTRRMPETGAYGCTIRTRCLSIFRVLRVGQFMRRKTRFAEDSQARTEQGAWGCTRHSHGRTEFSALNNHMMRTASQSRPRGEADPGFRCAHPRYGFERQIAHSAGTGSRSRRMFRARPARNVPPSEIQRAQGMPGACCTGSLACEV